MSFSVTGAVAFEKGQILAEWKINKKGKESSKNWNNYAREKKLFLLHSHRVRGFNQTNIWIFDTSNFLGEKLEFGNTAAVKKIHPRIT